MLAGPFAPTLSKPSSSKRPPMRRSFLFPLLLVACNGPAVSVDQRPNFDAPLDVDGVHLFIPVKWNRIHPSAPRPWPNGLSISTGGGVRNSRGLDLSRQPSRFRPADSSGPTAPRSGCRTTMLTRSCASPLRSSSRCARVKIAGLGRTLAGATHLAMISWS